MSSTATINDTERPEITVLRKSIVIHPLRYTLFRKSPYQGLAHRFFPLPDAYGAVKALTFEGQPQISEINSSKKVLQLSATGPKCVRFLCASNKGKKCSALSAPHTMNVQLAPCQKPLTTKMMKVLRTFKARLPLLPPCCTQKCAWHKTVAANCWPAQWDPPPAAEKSSRRQQRQ